MSRYPLRMLTLQVSLVLSAGHLAANQSPPQAIPQDRPQFRASIDLMRVEVTVLDKRTRKPVRGLTADDFIVKVNGDVQAIEALSEVEVAGREANRSAPFLEAAHDVASNVVTQPRLFVIVMDDALASREGFARAKGRDIAHAVVNGLGPNDMAAIVFAQDNRKAQDFTTDRAALRKAIESYDPKPVGPMGNLMSVSVLERSSAFLRRMPGYRRAIVWITLGPGDADLEGESLASWALEPQTYVNIDVPGDDLLQQALARATDRVVAGGVAPVPIYAYSTVGLRPVTASEIKGGRMPGLFGNEAMDKVARTTGGRQIYNTNAPDLEVPSMFAELSSYYALAFRSSFPMDGKLRWLHVEVKRPGVVVSTPDTSFATPKDMTAVRKASGAAKPAGLVEALSGPLPRGDIRLALGNVAVAVPGSKEQSVAMTLGIPAPSERSEGQQFALSLFVYDSEGLREILKQNQTVTSAPRRNADDALSEVVLPLSLRPGRYLVRVAVAETASGKAGSVYTTVTVPDFTREPLSFSGVAIGRAEGRPIGGREAIQSLLPFAPTVVREFLPTDRVGALVRVHQGTGQPMPVRLDTQILNADAEVVASQSTPFAPSDFSGGSGAEHRYELPLRSLAPGQYLLRFVATAHERRVTRDVRFSVR